MLIWVSTHGNYSMLKHSVAECRKWTQENLSSVVQIGVNEIKGIFKGGRHFSIFPESEGIWYIGKTMIYILDILFSKWKYIKQLVWGPILQLTSALTILSSETRVHGVHSNLHRAHGAEGTVWEGGCRGGRGWNGEKLGTDFQLGD